VVFDTYRVVDGVPVFIRPRDLYERIGAGSAPQLKGAFRCFLSKKVKSKPRGGNLVHLEREGADYRLELAEVVVMGRAKTPEAKVLAEEALSSMGLKMNPYGLASGVCFGFYLDSFDELDGAVRRVKDWVEALAIVNTVWYIRYGALINLRRLVEAAGFTPSVGTFKAVVGVVNHSVVRVFHNGVVGVHAPHTEDSVRALAEQLYSLFRKAGALL